MRRSLYLLLPGLVALVAACGDDAPAMPDAPDPDAETCTPAAGAAVSFDPDDVCRYLSSYRFFTDGPRQAPNDRVVPFDVNTPLFSDYTTKYRFFWVPEGTTMTYHDTESFALPVGSVIVKTFSYLHDLRDPSAGQRLLETRLLVHAADGWKGLTYVWNDEQTDARLRVAGTTIDATWIHTDGTMRQNAYVVPNTNQCAECHEETDGVMGPLGPKARHLNRDFDYPEGTRNQLQHLVDLGLLSGAPADPAADAPRAPVWNDEATGTLEERARAYLEINCAACHNPAGRARTSGLDLTASQTDLFKVGVCKAPVAAGPGSGGRQYNIVPGDPDDSILVFRMESVEPEIRMPELLRNQVHKEGVQLVRDWIAAMTPPGCM